MLNLMPDDLPPVYQDVNRRLNRACNDLAACQSMDDTAQAVQRIRRLCRELSRLNLLFFPEIYTISRH